MLRAGELILEAKQNLAIKIMRLQTIALQDITRADP
jgi:hypothetical protein